MIKYSIYPTLLDSFYWAKRLGKWQELIDKVNRVKTDVDWPEPVLKGMRFEAVINDLLDKKSVTHEFDENLVQKVFTKLQNYKAKQKYIQGNVKTPYGIVKCYGFVDYEYDDFYIDLKTGSKYTKNKYEINSQHKCYPLIGGKKSLTYMITDFSQIYYEPYVFTKELEDKFIFELTEFIEWLETNRGIITDTKIWGK